MLTYEQRLHAAAQRAERHRREAAYYTRLAAQEQASAEQIERTWGLDKPTEDR